MRARPPRFGFRRCSVSGSCNVMVGTSGEDSYMGALGPRWCPPALLQRRHKWGTLHHTTGQKQPEDQVRVQ